MKRLAFLLLALSLLLAACGGTPATPQEEAEPTEGTAAGGEMTDDAMTDDATTETPTTADGEMTDDAMTDDATTETPTTAGGEMTDDATTDDATAETPTTAGGEASTDSVQTLTIVPEESQVFYTVDEQFLREGIVDVTAVGMTQEVEGEIMLDPENPQNTEIGTITVDISTFESDEDRRDQAIRENWLESATYPIATFEPTSIEGLPESYTEGEELNFQIVGDLTVREQTQPVTFDTVAVYDGEELRGTATTTIQMTDFGFDPPNIANVLRAENDALLTLEFVARPQ
jgi:polyisoprenoid-binding protein YceI